jgi:hypothetical protein
LRVAINQPYFCPHRGWFRLLSETDAFVIYDDVQHIRRGWMSRNRLHDLSGEVRWLTLPLRKAPQETLIKDMRFAFTAVEEFRERLKPFGRFKIPMDIDGSMVDYLERTLKDTAQFLGIRWNAIRSSELGIAGLKAQDRILEICKRLGATHYLNAPGGKALYQPEAFAAAGVELEFLPEWTGSYMSVLEDLRIEPSGVAQLVEQRPVTPLVAGSSPAPGARS